MAKNHVQEGVRVPFTAPAGGVVSGNLYVIGAIVIIASVSAAEGEIFNGATCECWELPKVAADVVTEGATAYWTGSELTVEPDNGADANYKPVGYFINAAANGDTMARFMLVQGIAEDGDY